MTIRESFMTIALAALLALAVFALTVAVVTYGGSGLALFAGGVLVGWLLPRPRQ